MKKTNLKLLMLAFFFLAFGAASFAAGEEGDGPDGPPQGEPIDAGITALLVASVGLGIYAIAKAKNAKQNGMS